MREKFKIPAKFKVKKHLNDIWGDVTSPHTRSPRFPPDFDTWFSESVLKDGRGQPIPQYHGTTYDFAGSDFWPFSHFGSAHCANQFMRAREDSTLHKVVLSIKNPLAIPDLAAAHETWGIAGFLTEIGLMSQIENDRLHDIARNDFRPHPRCEEIRANPKIRDRSYHSAKQPSDFHAQDALAAHINAQGYDGFVYVNRREDIGSLSWIITRPDQVRHVYQYAAEGVRISKKTDVDLHFSAPQTAIYPEERVKILQFTYDHYANRPT